MSRTPCQVEAFEGQSYFQELIDFDWRSAGLPHFRDWDPALMSSLQGMDGLGFPVMLLIGQQGIMLSNTSMKALLVPSAGGDLTGRSILEIIPQCRMILNQTYSGEASGTDSPTLFSQSSEGETSWFQLDFTPVVNASGIIVGLQGIAVEVTQYVERIHVLTESEQRLCLALESSGMVGIWDLNVKTNISTADTNVARTFGLSPSDCQRGIDDGVFIRAIHAEDRPRVTQTLELAIRNKKPYRCKYRVRTHDEQQRWVITSGKPCYDEAGELIRLLGVVVDVTDQMETALALEKSRFEFETLTEALPQIVWSCDEQGRHDYFSARWSEFTGISPAEITENTWKQLVDPEHWQMVSKAWDEARFNGEPYDIDYRFRHHSGEFRWLRVMALPIRDENGSITRWFGTSTDIHDSCLVSAERERLALELERIAREDQLTEVLTRRAFVERATQAIQKAADQGTPIGLIMLDIDHFKSINDTYGHPGGDKVLSIAAKRIKASVDQHDFVGRLGGEEFGILLQNCTDCQAQKITERIRQAIHQDPIKLDNHLQIPVTISAGVTVQVPSTIDLDVLLLIADQALYEAKTSGRNRAIFLKGKS